MPFPDLPVELWQEILSYLPKECLLGLFGVSRTLYEMAMHCKYDDVVLISHWKDVRPMVEQLRSTHIARRVRRLTISPDVFAPPASAPSQPSQRDKLLSRLGLSKRRGTRQSLGTGNSGIYDEQEVLDLLVEAVSCCSILQEVTIILQQYSHHYTATRDIPALFFSFLDALWATSTIHNTLHKINLDAPLIKDYYAADHNGPERFITLDFTRTLSKSAQPALALNISLFRINNRRYCYWRFSSWYESRQCLASFTRAFSPFLSSLKISSPHNFGHGGSLHGCGDIGSLLALFPPFSLLKKLEIFIDFNSETLNKTSLTAFIQRNARHMEYLSINPSTTGLPDSYASWLAHEPPEHALVPTSFTQLTLPQLHTLNIALPTNWSERDEILLPDFYIIAPRLTTLVIPNPPLTTETVFRLLNRLPRENHRVTLKEFSYKCDDISPTIFDFLSKKLPLLQSLSIEYSKTSVDPGTDHSENFRVVMGSRQYFSWPVRHLRLSRTHSCGEGHPCEADMRAVASAISSDVVLDDTLRCSCP
ncbi:hypothetical protein CPC08DRAFT_762696 [Agrocybe pediades]|nr:hypothetical protein CPC08DRAFT_762696 [Agrocybe pediades]